MKKIINLLVGLCIILSMTSCLKSGLDDIEEYSGAEISAVSSVEYRYISDEISSASGQNIVKYVTLEYSGSKIDSKAATVSIPVRVPANFPEKELANLSASRLIVIVTLSSGAKIEPVSGAPELGKPGDWSKPNEYRVTAANGTRKNWTITVSGPNK